jgi:hypothetical protein
VRPALWPRRWQERAAVGTNDRQDRLPRRQSGEGTPAGGWA